MSRMKRTSRLVSTENWHGKATFVNTDVTKEEDVKGTVRLVSTERKRTSRLQNWHGKATFVNTDVTKEEDVKVS